MARNSTEMKKDTKDTIAVISAVVLLMFGVSLCTAGFIVSPVGVIDNSVLWIMGQCLIYAGSIFGLGVYVRATVRDEIKHSRGDSMTGRH